MTEPGTGLPGSHPRAATAGTDFLMPDLAALLAQAAPPGGPQHNDDGHRRPSCPAVPARPKRRIFPGRPDQVANARRFVSRVLARCTAADDAVLLTSELVTNTLQHTATGTGGDFTVIACHGTAGLRITVTDDGSHHVPALAPRRALPTSGQGLMLVNALAARWGHLGEEHGRSVWFELDCR